MNRRDFFKKSTSVSVGALAISTLSAQEVKENDKKLKAISTNSLEPEFTMKEDNLLINKNQRIAFSKCFGCFDGCGVRVRIDNKTDKVVKVNGNPYSTVGNYLEPLPLNTPIKEALKGLSSFNEAGLANRSTVCARGNAAIDAIDDPHRVTQCLKRVGKRGDNNWKTISYEELIKEVTQGGDLFGEGKVEGLKDIRDLHTPASKKYSDFGPKSNQLLVSGCTEQEAKWSFLKRFAHDSWGTMNVGCKDAYCGHQQFAGAGLGCFESTEDGTLPTVDYEQTEFAIAIGVNNGLSGTNLNAYARRLADAKQRENFKYLVVDPILRASVNEASKNNVEWLPIKSGTDTAFLFGMLNYIINNELYFKEYLAQPSQDAAYKIGQKNFTNATYLVVKDKKHPLYNQFLRANELDIGSNEEMVVIDKKSGKFVSSNSLEPAKLYFDGFVKDKNGKDIKVETAFSLLKKRVNEHTLNTYAKYCDVPSEKIIEVAKEFTSHGQKVGIETGSGCNAADGSIFAFAMIILNTLVGSHNAKGGLLHTTGIGYSFMYGSQEGPLYNFTDFEKVHVKGFPAERSGTYEESNEYKEKVAKGENPYPANEAWNPTYFQENTGEALLAHANANPFRFKAWLSCSTNPLYNCSGLKDQVIDSIIDPKKLPLFIAVDPFINETNIYADYIVPDLVQYEEWACARIWGSEYIADIASVPVVEPRTVKTKDLKSVCMEQFLIDIGKELKLPGFGKEAFKDSTGSFVELHTPEDYYVRLFANVAHIGTVLPSASDEDLVLSSVHRIAPEVKGKLKKEEFEPTLFLLSRGGRYEEIESRYDGKFFSDALRMDVQFQIYNEVIASKKDSYTGENFDGQPIFEIDKFWDGSTVESKYSKEEYPFKFSTFKSHLRNPYSVVFPRITALSPTNYIQMNKDDALLIGLKTGDKAKVISPEGKYIEGLVQADLTVARGSIVIPHGYGHSAFGVKEMNIDGRKFESIKSRSNGMSLNEFNMIDPTRKGASLYRDRWFGCTARHGVPVKVQKV